ncbi:MAG: retropepsin-like aspartic protease [Isosphaeraceae bacterium]
MTARPPASARLAAALSTFLVFPVLAALAADPPADAALKEKGLRRVGTTYVLTEEGEVQKQMNRVRSLSKAANAAAQQKTMYDREVQSGRAQMQEMEQQLLLLNQRLSQGQLAAQEHNQIVGMINTLSIRINQMRRAGSDETRQVVGARVASNREEFLQAVLDLRKLVDEVNGKYEAASKDAAIQAALDGLNKLPATKVKYTLGPSRSYRENLKLLERAEATVLTEDVSLRKEGGVYWVDATFNGKVTRSMVFDTGASSVVLPAEMAQEIGLTPGPTDRSSRPRSRTAPPCRHRMVIPSVRVGKFTVSNVECIVMPAGKKNVPPLLGQTFRAQLTIKFNADAGKLARGSTEATPRRRQAPVPRASRNRRASGRRGNEP